VAVGGKHKRGLLSQDLAIGLHALKEAIELGGLWILRVSARVNLRGLRIRLAADFLDLAVSRRLDLIQVALLLSRDAGGFAFTFGAEALRDLAALADHTLVDAVEHVRVVVHA